MSKQTTYVFHRGASFNPTGKLPQFITLSVPVEGTTFTVYHIHYESQTHRNTQKEISKEKLEKLVATYRAMKDLREFV